MLERLSGDPYWKRSIMHFFSPFFIFLRDVLWGQAAAHLRVASCLYRFPVLRVLVVPWLRGGGLLSPAAPVPVQRVCAVRTCVCVCTGGKRSPVRWIKIFASSRVVLSGARGPGGGGRSSPCAALGLSRCGTEQ